MKGRPKRAHKRKPAEISGQKQNPNPIWSPATEETSLVSGSSFNTDHESTMCAVKCTQKTSKVRSRKTPEVLRTSSRIHGLSTDLLPSICDTHTEAEDGTHKTKVESQPASYRTRSQSRKRSIEAAVPTQNCKKRPVIQTTCSPAKRHCSKKPNKRTITASSSEPSQPRFEPKQDESLMSSDLSIELSDHKEVLPPLSFLEDEDKDSVDEEELPSYPMQRKPQSIAEGAFVWCKYRHFPTWPALVKQVNHKAKKASIIFIDNHLSKQKRGFIVALTSLKPFDCEGADELAAEAKKEYAPLMKWALELITDYSIRIACGSFSGSIIDYFAHGMSYPVRRKYPQASSEQQTAANDLLTEEEPQPVSSDEDCEQQEEVNKCVKRLLPDRTQAKYNRLNEKLVHFIVKQRMVEERLLNVIRGQVQSKWLHFHRSKRRLYIVNMYLEDSRQLDMMYSYLNDLYETAANTGPCHTVGQLMKHIPFVLDVLLPEAITYAIAKMDNISIMKAEEKYLKGRCLSNRERQQYDYMIEQHFMKKS